MKTESQKLREEIRRFSQQGHWELAIKSAQQILEDERNDVRTMLLLGDLYLRQGDKQSAIQAYQDAAEFYTKQGYYLKAVAVYKEVIRWGLAAIEAKKKLAALYRQLGLENDANDIEKELEQLLTKQENSS